MDATCIALWLVREVFKFYKIFYLKSLEQSLNWSLLSRLKPKDMLEGLTTSWITVYFDKSTERTIWAGSETTTMCIFNTPWTKSQPNCLFSYFRVQKFRPSLAKTLMYCCYPIIANPFWQRSVRKLGNYRVTSRFCSRRVPTLMSRVIYAENYH